jgi:serine O-acetyltransferase
LPYGSPCDDLPDPTARALCGLLNEVEALRRRVAQLEAEKGPLLPGWQPEEAAVLTKKTGTQ